MRPIHAEFLRPKPARWPWFVLAAVLSATAAWQGREAWGIRASIVRVDEESAALRSKIALARAAASSADAAVPRPQPIDEATARMARFDWNGAFASIHAARVQGVRLTAVDIAAREGSVRLELEATRTDDILAYLGALNEGEPDAKWHLSRMQVGSGQPPTTATIEAARGAFTGK